MPGTVLSELPISVGEFALSTTSYLSTPAILSSILSFAIIILVIHHMAKLLEKGFDANEVLKALGIPLIIAASIMLVITGVPSSTMTPIIGLLGTIAGYLLGKTEDRLPRDKKKAVKIDREKEELTTTKSDD